ncbi:hypothetical protein E0H40_13800 [Rhizobium leguminosarum bv. viciae]|nr:hypothetical protein E0H40_13800 [Rhizobium leguminosarum bv. viciae]
MEKRAADHSFLDAAFREASLNVFFPLATVRCPDQSAFRSQIARDLGCLLDVDETVVAWSCLCFGVHVEDRVHVVDFMVDHIDGTREFLDAVEFFGDPAVTETIACMRRRHRFVMPHEIYSGHRLQNAKDLLHYARRRTPSNDRVRLLAALNEAGSMAIGETFSLFREVPPLTAIAWMALHRFISIDLDDALIGPDTLIRRSGNEVAR